MHAWKPHKIRRKLEKNIKFSAGLLMGIGTNPYACLRPRKVPRIWEDYITIAG